MRAIAGTQGSIVDIYGTGAEILRDNNTVSVLNKRGHDNGVSIEYAKNMTGLDIDFDDSSLITRIKAYARYNNEENEEVIVHSEPKYVDSPRIANYETPFIAELDLSSKFDETNPPTPAKIKKLVEDHFTDTKCDLVKENIKVEFIPLSKCVGYSDIQDKISLCDTVRIIDSRYNLDTKAKVIKATYNILTERYEKMELGEARTSLGDLISGSTGGVEIGGDNTTKPPIIGDNNFPNTLPAVPTLDFKLYGFDRVGLNWTFENKIYYNYELYASRTKDFIPNTFDLIHSGDSSSFQHQCKPSETWYYRVRAVNTHGKATAFSNQVTVETVKIENLENYVSNAAIGDALIGELNLGRGWVGQLNAQLLNVKGNFSVTDGNGKRTMDIDSFGNITLLPTNFKMLIDGKEEAAVTQSSFNATVEGINMNVSKKADTKEVNSLIEQKANNILMSVSTSGGGNILDNSGFTAGKNKWSDYSYSWNQPYNKIEIWNDNSEWVLQGTKALVVNSGYHDNSGELGIGQIFKVKQNKTYTISCLMATHRADGGFHVYDTHDWTWLGNSDVLEHENFGGGKDINDWKKISVTFNSGNRVEIGIRFKMTRSSGDAYVFMCQPMLNEGTISVPWIEKTLDAGNLVSSINVSPEDIKIKSNKIQLEGAVTAGTGGRQVKINNGDYSAIIDGSEKMFFGSRDFENNYRVPKFYMGAYGFNANEHNYFGMTSYRGNGDNPEGNGYAYQDLSYRCINSNFSDWSNIKMYSSGRIRLAPVENLEITTNYVGGAYQGAEERRLALFATSTSPYFNSNLQIACCRNMTNSYGFIIADDSVAGAETRVRCHTDLNRQKFFRPCDNVADISNGSASFPWKSVTSKTAYVTDNIINNPVVRTTSETKDVLDNIEFIQARGIDEPVKMDVSKISGTSYAPVQEDVQVIDTTELLKLALMEIKKLKERINILETR